MAIQAPSKPIAERTATIRLSARPRFTRLQCHRHSFSISRQCLILATCGIALADRPISSEGDDPETELSSHLALLQNKELTLKDLGSLESQHHDHRTRSDHLQWQDVERSSRTVVTAAPGHFDVIGPQGVNFKDVKEGELGTCYFLAALIAIARLHPRMIEGLFIRRELWVGTPPLFTTRWLINGLDITVVVDDMVPVNPDTLRPYFSKPNTKADFWPVILEKSWAKIFGSFKNVVGGHMTEAYRAVAGCPVEKLDHDSRSDELPSHILEALDNQYPVGSASGPNNVGIPDGHAYIIYNISESKKYTWVLTMYNPWARDVYEGEIPNPDKTDGFFDMTYDEYLDSFVHTTIAKLHDNYTLSTVFLKSEDPSHTQLQALMHIDLKDDLPFTVNLEWPSTRFLPGCTKLNPIFILLIAPVNDPTNFTFGTMSSRTLTNARVSMPGGKGEYVFFVYTSFPNGAWMKYITLDVYANQHVPLHLGQYDTGHDLTNKSDVVMNAFLNMQGLCDTMSIEEHGTFTRNQVLINGFPTYWADDEEAAGPWQLIYFLPVTEITDPEHMFIYGDNSWKAVDTVDSAMDGYYFATFNESLMNCQSGTYTPPPRSFFDSDDDALGDTSSAREMFDDAEVTNLTNLTNVTLLQAPKDHGVKVKAQKRRTIRRPSDEAREKRDMLDSSEMHRRHHGDPVKVQDEEHKLHQHLLRYAMTEAAANKITAEIMSKGEAQAFFRAERSEAELEEVEFSDGDHDVAKRRQTVSKLKIDRRAVSTTSETYITTTAMTTEVTASETYISTTTMTTEVSTSTTAKTEKEEKRRRRIESTTSETNITTTTMTTEVTTSETYISTTTMTTEVSTSTTAKTEKEEKRRRRIESTTSETNITTTTMTTEVTTSETYISTTIMTTEVSTSTTAKKEKKGPRVDDGAPGPPGPPGPGSGPGSPDTHSDDKNETNETVEYGKDGEERTRRRRRRRRRRTHSDDKDETNETVEYGEDGEERTRRRRRRREDDGKMRRRRRRRRAVSTTSETIISTTAMTTEVGTSTTATSTAVATSTKMETGTTAVTAITPSTMNLEYIKKILKHAIEKNRNSKKILKNSATRKEHHHRPHLRSRRTIATTVSQGDNGTNATTEADSTNNGSNDTGTTARVGDGESRPGERRRRRSLKASGLDSKWGEALRASGIDLDDPAQTADAIAKAGILERAQCNALMRRLLYLDNADDIHKRGVDVLFPAGQASIGDPDGVCMEASSDAVVHCSEYNHWNDLAFVGKQVYVMEIAKNTTMKQMKECILREKSNNATEELVVVTNTCNETIVLSCMVDERLYMLGPLTPKFNGTGPVEFLDCPYTAKSYDEASNTTAR